MDRLLWHIEGRAQAEAAVLACSLGSFRGSGRSPTPSPRRNTSASSCVVAGVALLPSKLSSRAPAHWKTPPQTPAKEASGALKEMEGKAGARLRVCEVICEVACEVICEVVCEV